ncbi:hypothetical protein [Mycobacterium sp. Aquia_213]|uniref:hypothetical protein n=1 Tax=Mycobacterium sp. Aquia_213 TaxID=2991728 RepID=UPI00226F8279|nr:hypothetical protein [Mycobacterium sp. Aquia_213]WAC92219.1 hypothetical protein LMQ14_03140 [Mycobacterium sp. Aquia_213]
MSLFQSGDEIALPIQRNGVGPVEYHLATITALEDDEPNRRIRMTFNIPAFDRIGTQDVRPGDLMHRMTATDDSRDPVYVAARDLWKWEGLMISDPDGNGRVRILRTERGPHPSDSHEILALVVEDEQHQRRPIFVEMTGGLFCEWY